PRRYEPRSPRRRPTCAKPSRPDAARPDDQRTQSPREEKEMTITATESTITDREAAQVERANASGATPVVFVHGLWLLPSSWDRGVDLFEEAGYAGLTPSWPDDPETVDEARANPDVLAKKTLKQIADHTAEIINGLDKKPAVIGHSTGGLLAQMLADRGLS